MDFINEGKTGKVKLQDIFDNIYEDCDFVLADDFYKGLKPKMNQKKNIDLADAEVQLYIRDFLESHENDYQYDLLKQALEPYYDHEYDLADEDIQESYEVLEEDEYLDENATFEEIIYRMECAEIYEDLYNAAMLIVDPKLQNEVTKLIQQCEEDGDDVEEAYSIVTSDLLDMHINDKNVENLNEDKKIKTEEYEPNIGSSSYDLGIDFNSYLEENDNVCSLLDYVKFTLATLEADLGPSGLDSFEEVPDFDEILDNIKQDIGQGDITIDDWNKEEAEDYYNDWLDDLNLEESKKIKTEDEESKKIKVSKAALQRFENSLRQIKPYSSSYVDAVYDLLKFNFGKDAYVYRCRKDSEMDRAIKELQKIEKIPGVYYDESKGLVSKLIYVSKDFGDYVINYFKNNSKKATEDKDIREAVDKESLEDIANKCIKCDIDYIKEVIEEEGSKKSFIERAMEDPCDFGWDSIIPDEYYEDKRLYALIYDLVVKKENKKESDEIDKSKKIKTEVKKTLDDVYSDSATEALWDEKFKELVPNEGKANTDIGEIMRCFASMSHAYLQNGEIIQNMQRSYLEDVIDLDKVLKRFGDQTLITLLDKMDLTRSKSAYDHYMAEFYEYFVNTYLKDNKEIKEESEENSQEFDYRLLSRLKSDCDYYLGNGNRNAEHCLWAKNEQGQIDKMREIYNQLKEKPEWLSEEDINNYAKEMGVVDLPSTTNGTAEKEIQDMLDRSEKRSKENLDEGTYHNKVISKEDFIKAMEYAKSKCKNLDLDVRPREYQMHDGAQGIYLQLFKDNKFVKDYATGTQENLEDMKKAIDKQLNDLIASTKKEEFLDADINVNTGDISSNLDLGGLGALAGLVASEEEKESNNKLEEDTTIWSSEYDQDDEVVDQAYQDYLNNFEASPKTPSSFEDWLQDTFDLWLDAEADNYNKEHPGEIDKLSDQEIDAIDQELRDKVQKEIEANMDDLKDQYEEYCEEIQKEMTSPLDKEKWEIGFYEQDAQDQWEVKDQDFSDNIWPMIEAQCNEDILILLGSVGRWNGTFNGGKIIYADEKNLRNTMSDYDEVSVIADSDNVLYIDYIHHDGSDTMYLYTIPQDLTELAKAMNYDDPDELDTDIRQDYVDMEELAKHADLLVPVINKGRGNV